ncbi:MAG: zf-HC2 domain-containing protein [Clostridia bacterium]|nr:zf-HC2 domain-containing protein [Clostridia bacterium]
MKLPCAVVRDLLPLHTEGLTEPETDTLIQEHLEDCAPCAERLATLREEAPKPLETAKPLKSLKKQIRLRRWLAALMAGLVVFVALFTCFYHTGSMQLLPWEEGLVQVKGVETVSPEHRYGRSVIRLSGDETAPDAYTGEALVLQTDSRIAGWKNETFVEDGITTLILQGAARRSQTRAEKGTEYGELMLYPVPDRIIYGYTDPQQLLYGEEADFGVQVLPRLALAYYRLIAAVLALGLGAAWLLLRKKPCAALLRQLFFAPLSWLIAQLLLKGLDATSFFLEWELGWILLMAAAVYGLLTLGCLLWKQHREAAV